MINGHTETVLSAFICTCMLSAFSVKHDGRFPNSRLIGLFEKFKESELSEGEKNQAHYVLITKNSNAFQRRNKRANNLNTVAD